MKRVDGETGDAKQCLRREVAARVRALTPDFRREADRRIRMHCLEWLSGRPPGILLLTRALPDEVPLDPLWSAIETIGWTIAVPRMRPCGSEFDAVAATGSVRWETGRWGTLEPDPARPPLPPERLAALWLPARALSPAGARLGRGRGCFDRFLARCPADLPMLAVVYSTQVVPCIPVEPHDRAVGGWIDEAGFHYIS